jgi:hypothetical protein
MSDISRMANHDRLNAVMPTRFVDTPCAALKTDPGLGQGTNGSGS